MTTNRSALPDLKEWWDELNDVYSKVLQTVVERLFDNLRVLSKLKENGVGVGQFKWKPPLEYDLVAVEDLNIKGMLEPPSNSRITASAAWGTFPSVLEYKFEHEGRRFVAVEPEGTTKECGSCGVSRENRSDP